MVPEYRSRFDGWEDADSIVVNPHKWLFTPFDLSAFYCRRMDIVRQAFSLVPDYLVTAEGARGVRNLMDTGIQLGRRFRSLKLWMVLRHFGAEGIRAAILEHIRLAQLFSRWIDEDPRFERRRSDTLQRRLLPSQAAARADRCRTRRVQRASARCRQRNWRSFPVAHTAQRRVRAAARHRSPSHDGAARRESLGTAQGALCRGAIAETGQT